MNQNYDIIPIPISIRGCDGRYIYVNKAWCEMFSLNVENALGFTDLELNLDPLSFPEGEEGSEKGEYSFRDVLVTTTDKGRLLLELIETRIEEAKGSPKIMCVHQDMTGIGWRMDDLTRNMQRCESSMKHCIQQTNKLIQDAYGPINQIIIFCDKLENSTLDTRQRGMVQTLRDNTRIIQKSLRIDIDSSIYDEDSLAIGTESFLVEPMTSEVIKLYENVARDKNVIISTRISEDLAEPVITDRSHLRQILVNMLESAIRGSSGGNVCMEASMTNNSNTPLFIKVKIEHPKNSGKNAGGSNLSDTSLGLSRKILKGLCGIVGGRLEICSEGDGSKNLKVFLPAKFKHSGKRKK